MARKRIDAKELAQRFNELRLHNLNESYSMQELIMLLKSVGINQTLTSYLTSRKYIWKSNGMYSFLKEPLHYSVFEMYFQTMRSKKKALYERKKEKKLGISKFEEENCEEITPEDEKLIISILKRKGYKIFKPHIEYDEL